MIKVFMPAHTGALIPLPSVVDVVVSAPNLTRGRMSPWPP
jgi:hypothetical protein